MLRGATTWSHFISHIVFVTLCTAGPPNLVVASDPLTLGILADRSATFASPVAVLIQRPRGWRPAGWTLSPLSKPTDRPSLGETAPRLPTSPENALPAVARRKNVSNFIS